MPSPSTSPPSRPGSDSQASTRRGSSTAIPEALAAAAVADAETAAGRSRGPLHGIPIGVNDYIADDQTVGTSNDCSTVYAVQFGEGALSGLTAPGGLTVERVGSLETKDASRIRVKWYASVALFNTVKLAKLIGIRP